MKHKNLLIVVLVLAFCTTAFMALNQSYAKAQGPPGPAGYVNEGDIVWMSTLSQGETVIVTFQLYQGLPVIVVSVTPDYMDPDGTVRYTYNLPNLPVTKVVVTGYGRAIRIAVQQHDSQNATDPVFLTGLDLSEPFIIPSDAESSTVYIPLMSK
jgi:hypothetical protein